MPRESLGRRLFSAVADSTSAFSDIPAAAGTSRWRRLLSALADSTSAFRPEGKADEFVSAATWPGRSSRLHNELKTALLVFGFSALIISVSAAFGRTALVIGLVLALGMNAYAYFNAGKVALRIMDAYPVSDIEQPVLHRIVRSLSTSARQPMPKLYVSPTKAPTVFAAGRSPRTAAVCCSAGILNLLDERELRAILGRELARIHNREVLPLSVGGALAGMITIFGLAANFAPALAMDGDDSDSGRQPSIVGTIFMAVSAPLGAIVVHLVAGRGHDRRADLAGAELTEDPLALASALRKLKAGTKAAPLEPELAVVVQSHLMIVNPFQSSRFPARWFYTHSPLDDRIHALEGMAGLGRG